MKRVFLDTNILLSGIVFRGNEHQVLLLGLTQDVQLVISQDVLEEAAEVLERKFPRQAHLAAQFIQLANIRIVPKNTYEKLIGKQKVRDPDDRHVLAAATASKCRYIVTGDRDLLVLGTVQGTKILASRQLLRLF